MAQQHIPAPGRQHMNGIGQLRQLQLGLLIGGGELPGSEHLG